MTARGRRLVGAAAAALLVAPAFGGGIAAAATMDDVASTDAAAVVRVERALRDGLHASGIPSAAFVVVDGTGTSARGLGDAAGGRAVTGQTPFVLGSTSKSFTALAVMQLVDAGRVDLDAPVRRYVPELQLSDGEAVDAITVRHILQHTSGIPGAAGGPVLASAADGSAEDAVDELRDVSLTAPPGQTWQYSNANYVLAGLVVQRASGMPYGRYVQTRIFDPLGMIGSDTDAARAREAGLAPGHRYWFGVPFASGPVVRPGMMAAGYLVSTAEDLGRYLSMYLAGGLAADGTRIVSAQGLATMLAPGPTAHLGAWAGGKESRYAMGWFVGGPWEHRVVFHPGNSPDTTAMIALMPERGAAVATLLSAGHELPVPGNPSITDRVSSTAVQATLGDPVTAVPSIWRFYAVFDAVVLVLAALATGGLVRALRAVKRPEPRRFSRRVGGVLTYLAVTAVLLAVPLLIGFGWTVAWTWAPDLALVLFVLSILSAATALARLVGLRPSPLAPLPARRGTGPRGVLA